MNNWLFSFRMTLLAFVLLGSVLNPAALSGATPLVQRHVLPNGLILLVSENHALPFVTIRFVIDAGAWRDPEESGGLANLTAEGLLLGSAERSAEQLNEQVDALGAALSVSCGYDYAALNFKVLKPHLTEGCDLFADAILQPTFPEAQIRRQIRVIQSALNQEEDEPGVLAQKAFQRELFRYAPYGHSVEGTIESLNTLSVQQVRAFYDRHYRPENGIIVVVGDIGDEEIRRIAGRFGGWERGQPSTKLPEKVFESSTSDVRIDRRVTQTNIILGHAGIARDNPDFHAVVVMNEILGGGGFTSRLLQRIRVEKGLAYSVSSYFDARRFPGSFQVVLQTRNATADEAVAIAREEMRRMQRELVSDQELDTARNYLIGSFPLRYASQHGLAQLLGYIEYYQLGLDYFSEYADRIRGIQKQDVLAAAREYLLPDQAIVAMVADLRGPGVRGRDE